VCLITLAERLTLTYIGCTIGGNGTHFVELGKEELLNFGKVNIVDSMNAIIHMAETEFTDLYRESIHVLRT
jgi:hypothetical protein